MIFTALCLASCGQGPKRSSETKPTRAGDTGPTRDVDLSHVPDPTPKREAKSRYGNPPVYSVFGKQYHVQPSSVNYHERGIASWYGQKFHGRRTSNGEVYDMYQVSAAHKTLPLPTYLRVKNLENGREIVVRVNDRGPFVENRIIDLSYAAAYKLDVHRKGTSYVEVKNIEVGELGKPVVAHAARPTRIPVSNAKKPSGWTLELYLQLGAFQDRGNAEQLKNRLQEKNFSPVRITETTKNNRPLYRVRFGPLKDVEHLDRVAADMESRGFTQRYVVIE